MARRKSSTFTEVELEFMQILWDKHEASTEDIEKQLRENGRFIPGGAIRRMLAILIEKGHLTRKRSGRNFLYKAKESKKQATRYILKDFINRVFNGSVSNMVTTIIDVHEMNDSIIEEIKQVIAQREKEKKQ